MTVYASCWSSCEGASCKDIQCSQGANKHLPSAQLPSLFRFEPSRAPMGIYAACLMSPFFFPDPSIFSGYFEHRSHARSTCHLYPFSNLQERPRYRSCISHVAIPLPDVFVRPVLPLVVHDSDLSPKTSSSSKKTRITKQEQTHPFTATPASHPALFKYCSPLAFIPLPFSLFLFFPLSLYLSSNDPP